LRDFRLDWALFVDLVVAGNFHGFLGWIWIFLNGFYCFWFSDRSRSSVKVVVNREFWWVLGSNPYFLIRPPVSCFFVFFLIILCNFPFILFFFKSQTFGDFSQIKGGLEKKF
jgi:hypothetical protein